MINLTAGSSIRLLATLGVDLTGQTVSFNFAPVNPASADASGYIIDLTGGGGQTRPATVVDALNGQVQYTLTPTDTAIGRAYRGQFEFTTGGETSVFPENGWIEFQVADFVAPGAFSALPDFYEPVRAIMGDFEPPYDFEDAALASVIRSVVRLGSLPGFGITNDGLSITPTLTQPRDLALLTLNSAKILLRPRIASFEWGSRALRSRTGEQGLFFRDLENAVFYAENPTMLSSFQSFYAWVNSLAGMNVWELMSEMKVQGPVATVTIGTAGITVSTR